MQTYSRKAGKSGVGTGFVFGEAKRLPECCTHVENPGEPQTVYGQGIEAIELEHDASVENARSVNVKGQSRKLRQDQHTLLTVIASHPATPDQVRADPAVAREVQEWQDRTIAWLKEAHGDDLKGVIRHDDEGHVHLHAYVIPSDPGMAARALHPGVIAKKAFMASEGVVGLPDLAANRLGDKAYKAAMREWQDAYWQTVGLACGLTRIGPGRRRLSRADWQAEQAQVERVASLEPLLAQVGKAEAAVDRGEAMVVKLREQVAAALAERDAAIRAAQAAKLVADQAVAHATKQADGIIAKAKKQAASIIAGARREGERLKSMGTALGGFVQGILGASPSKVEALVRADERQRAAEEIQGVRVELKEVRGELRQVKQAKVELVDSLQRVAGQRDDAWAALNRDPNQTLANFQGLMAQ